MLSQLTAGALADAKKRRELISYSDLEAKIDSAPPVRDALEALAPAEHVKVLAEIKRASPSRGDLATISDPVSLAQVYEIAGASAISVLTEERKFKGTLDDLAAVRAHVNLPVLRKDFIAEEYQILEARVAGADLVLLIVAALDQSTLQRLHTFATQLGMSVLVETHDAQEVSRALEVDPKILGINARSLSTFELDRDLFAELSPGIPGGIIKVAESAVRDVTDVKHYRSAGADVVLVGEALVIGDPGAMLAEFLTVA